MLANFAKEVRLGAKRIWWYYLAVFLGSFLLFQVQLLMGKALLPAFGGSYMVWATCMVFFQGFLLLGYLYVHKAQKWAGIIRYSKWHWVFLLLSFTAFPFKFEKLCDIAFNMPAAAAVFWILFISVGLPFFSLSTISVILQSWISKSDLEERKNPYILYSASNLGSLLALLSYPVVFEPLFTLEEQGRIWWACFFVLSILVVKCIPCKNNEDINEKTHRTTASVIFSIDKSKWFLLSAAGCMALLAITNMIVYGIASVPFLWVLPLAVYLATFVVTFKRRCWYPEWVKQAFYWVIPFGMALYIFTTLQLGLPVIPGIIFHLAVLFIICINCNGRLIQIKPENTEDLTAFYLVMAAGGLLGSLIVSNVIPVITNTLLEYPLAFAFASFAMALSETRNAKRASPPAFRKEYLYWAFAAVFFLTLMPWALKHILHIHEKASVIFIAIPVFLVLRAADKKQWMLSFLLVIVTLSSQWTEELFFSKTTTERTRNFYGIFCVFEAKGQRYLTNGPTVHGRQYKEGPKALVPISYYHKTTPAGELLSLDPFKFRKIAMIGLGTGGCAAYMKAGQEMTIYELNPDNLKLAEKWFTYLRMGREKGANIDIVFGDGRILLRKVKENAYDLLILDAFNGGSIPVHLLTLEAFKEYFRVLTKDGVILFNISNKVIDFRSVIYAAARTGGFYTCEKSNAGSIDPDADPCTWMVCTNDKTKYKILLRDYGWISYPDARARKTRPWTDQYIDLISHLQ